MIPRAILQTLTYSDHFGYPLTLPELHRRLIGVQTSRAELSRQLIPLLRSGQVAQTDHFFHLPGRSALVARRLRRTRASLAPQARARNLVTRLSRVPGVLALYLTGSLAVSNSRANSDIDLMVIAQPGRLWTTRLLLTVMTEFLGLRRRPRSSQPRLLCLNLYLTPTAYLLPPSRRSLYTAYELIQAVPLYDPHHTHSALLSANSWLKVHLPNYVIPATKVDSSRYKGLTLSVFEQLAYHLQRWYMRRKMTREYVTPDSAFFHPRDPGARVLSKLSLLK